MQVTGRGKKAEVVVRRSSVGWMAFTPSKKPEAKSSAKKRRGRYGRMEERSEGVNSFIATGKITQIV